MNNSKDRNKKGQYIKNDNVIEISLPRLKTIIIIIVIIVVLIPWIKIILNSSFYFTMTSFFDSIVASQCKPNDHGANGEKKGYF